MTKRQAEQLAKVIDRTEGCEVRGLRHWGRGKWELDCVDTRTGYTFVVSSIEDWQERLQASELAEVRDEIP